MDSATRHSPRRRMRRGRFLTLLTIVAGIAGCAAPEKPVKPIVKYPPHPADPTMPVYLKNSVMDLTITRNTGDFPVSSWGLIVNLRGTGDSTCPSLVREWMIKQIGIHKFGLPSSGYGKITAESMLDDPHVAVVAVLANIPPGARRGQYIDAMVRAMPGNNTSSLANGMLYRADLRINGLSDPVGAVNVFAKAQGNIFVNPVYAANQVGAGGAATMAPSRESLRMGYVPGGGLVMTDRPIHLVLRNPSWATSRAIEYRINERFKTTNEWNDPAAIAQDEGYLHLMVPRSYHGDWQHFVGVATHLFLNDDPAFSGAKARVLAMEAVKPDAKLEDISYCLEGLGQAAMPYITPLMSNPQPDVQFAAARAAAFIGDAYGIDRLVQIAKTPDHPFRINAVGTLGDLPQSELIDAQLAKLLDANEFFVRRAAYEVLIKHNSPHILSTPIQSPLNPENEFILDMVPSEGPPLIYCTRVGRPRVAIFGRHVSVRTPVMFSAFDSKLTISDNPRHTQFVNVFYQDEGRPTPVQLQSPVELSSLVARLGGMSDEGLHFTYGDVVAILQSMSDQKAVNAAFVLQDLPQMAKQIEQAPSLPDSRPQADPSPVNPSAPASLPDLRPATTQPVAAENARPQ